MEFDWKAIERFYGKELTDLYQKTLAMLAEEKVTIGQAIRLGHMLKVETEEACKTVEVKVKNLLNDSQLEKP